MKTFFSAKRVWIWRYERDPWSRIDEEKGDRSM